MPVMSCAPRSPCTRRSSSWPCATEGARRSCGARSPRRSRRPIVSRSWPRTSSSWLAPTRAALSIEAKPVEVRDLFAAVRGRLGGPAREAGRSLVVDDPDGLVIEADPRPRGAGTRQSGRERPAPRERSDPPLGPGHRGWRRASRERRRPWLPARFPSPCLRALQARRYREGRGRRRASGSRSSTRSPRPTAGAPRPETRPRAARTSGSSWAGSVDRPLLSVQARIPPPSVRSMRTVVPCSDRSTSTRSMK